jgi:lactaldehyde dehydrogenase / glycolaldehyde dehydrogenase
MSATIKHYIDGEFVSSASEQTIDVLNPSTGEAISEIPVANKSTVDDAVDAAARAQSDWEKLPPIERAGYLREIAAKIRSNAPSIARTLVLEQGKIQGLAEVEVGFTADYLDYMAEWARRLEGEVVTSDRPNETIFLFRQAIGVVAGILPWNFPFFLIARKLAPALLTGNTIVIKPSEETPINAAMFTDLAATVGLPKGVFNMVYGDGAVTGNTMSSNSGVGLVSFTGSVATGSKIMANAAQNITKVNLELGGKAPAIVLEDADLDLAVDAITASRVINSGQVCNCAERVYIQDSVADEFTAKLVEKMAAVKFGDPNQNADVEYGPMINRAQMEKVHKAVQDAQKAGGELLTGGQMVEESGGNYFTPTVIAGCDQSSSIMQSEVFGPVIPIKTVSGIEEAISMANDSEYGLTSSIYTSNLNSAMKACRDLKFGETYVNRENFEAMQGFHAGVRKSGIGGADGKHGLYEYTQSHMVYIQGN